MLKLNPVLWIRYPVCLLACLFSCVCVCMRCCNRIFSLSNFRFDGTVFLFLLAIANHFTIILYANAINTLAIFYQINMFYTAVSFFFTFCNWFFIFIFGNFSPYIRCGHNNIHPKTTILLTLHHIHHPRIA